MNYQEAIAFLQSFPDMERGTHGATGPTMTLPTMKALLERMGNPQHGRHSVHITGSKGKGSTVTMLTNILVEAGYKTALYTSPHLESYTERIAFDLKPVDEQLFADGLEAVKQYLDPSAGPYSTFGILTSLFFYLVNTAQPKVDVQLIEVGVGGRFDSTNVVDNKDLVIITPVSLEHTQLLGTTPTEIAANKAGIITPGAATVLAPQKDGGAKASVGRRAREVGSTLVDMGGRAYKIKPIRHDLTGQTFQFDGPHGSLELEIGLLGAHQMVNAATAASAALALHTEKGFNITPDHIRQGLIKTRLGGRFEVLAGHGSASEVDATAGDACSYKGQTIVADGAHNHESAAALLTAIKALYPGKKCVFVLGVGMDKNVHSIWRELSPLAKMLVATRAQNARAMDPNSIVEAISVFDSSHTEAIASNSVPAAVEAAILMAEEDDLVCITGSLFVVAEARTHVRNLLKLKAKATI